MMERLDIGSVRFHRHVLPLLLVALLTPEPHGRAQNPGALAGSTLGQNLRNAAAATRNQAATLVSATDNWRRRADSVNYTDAQFQQDMAIIQSHFQQLRVQFNWLGQLALQLGRPNADNAVAELDAGLNIIAEPLLFLGHQYAAGTLDRATVARMARVFQSAIQEWEQELKKDSSRLGVVW
jgi:hypothetical protein